MKRKIRFREYIFFAEAWLCLAVARFLLIFIPFKRILPLLGKTVADTMAADETVMDKRPAAILADEKTAKKPAVLFPEISLAISRACRYAFWRTQCFEQALAAKMMLKISNHSGIIYFGVYKSPGTDRLHAHAWVESNGILITGGKNLDKYTVISRFSG